MSYNPRMSMAPRATAQNQRAPAPTEGDAFMTLVCAHLPLSMSASLTASKPDHEIAGCITDIGIKFSVSDLQKPNPQIIQKVFEWLAELLMNTTREVVAPAMRAAAEDMCGGGEAERIFTSDTRDLMAFFVILRKLLREVSRPNSEQGMFRKKPITNTISVVFTTSHSMICTSPHMAASSRSSHT
jgi:kinetochore protein Nuf2